MQLEPEPQQHEAPSSIPKQLEHAQTTTHITQLDLKNQNLTSIPLQIRNAAHTLSKIDIGNNPIRSLQTLDKRFHKLKILFATNCNLKTALVHGNPLTTLPALFMLSLKQNQLEHLDGMALPPTLGWLIATENSIAGISNVERLSNVRKLMLSHNRLDSSHVQEILMKIPKLEMLRIACNRLERMPPALSSHTHLAWIALAGNPFCQRLIEDRLRDESAATVAHLDDASMVEVGETTLGQGSGAVVKRGVWNGKPVAVKLWTASHFSDGDAIGEWNMGRLTGGCEWIVRSLAAWNRPTLGMCVELLEDASAVAGPPSFESVTRDAFIEGKHPKLSAAEAIYVAIRVALACNWLHRHGIYHGDVYLHNTLRSTLNCEDSEVSYSELLNRDDVRLSDLGAATVYDVRLHYWLQKIEVRSFGYLLLDLLSWLHNTDSGNESAILRDKLVRGMTSCANASFLDSDVPQFEEIAWFLHQVLQCAISGSECVEKLGVPLSTSQRGEVIAGFGFSKDVIADSN